MSLNVDLHCHSNQSDGVLTPAELAARAATNGVNVWALTDHDEISGLVKAQQTAINLGMQFINGVEISASYCDKTIHVVGLNFDSQNIDLLAGLSLTRERRAARALQIAARLTELGIENSWSGAMAFVDNPRLIGRVHFAKYLLANGHCKNLQDAFDRYLGENKKAFVPMQWLSLEQTVNLILHAGGKAVLAHPGRYKYTRQQFTHLFDKFKDIGGQAIEVITGNHNLDEANKFARLAYKYNFEASRGSDFHAPGIGRIDLGNMPDLPANLKPVWHDFI